MHALLKYLNPLNFQSLKKGIVSQNALIFDILQNRILLKLLKVQTKEDLDLNKFF